MPNPFGLFDEGDPTDPTYRATMLPVGSYKNPDSSERLGFAWPGMLTEPINALARLGQNSQFPDGRLGIPNPQNPENQQDVLTGLLSMYGGNALNPLAAVPKGGLASGTVRAYRGALNPENIARENAATLWGSSSPDVASTYARTPYGDGPTGSVAPVDFSFQNPLVVDAGGSSWMSIPHNGGATNADSLAFRARADGHDGLIIRNVQDAANRLQGEEKLPLADTFAALQRGTVRSPLTGETLFSDTGRPSLLGGLTPPDDPQRPRNSLLDF